MADEVTMLREHFDKLRMAYNDIKEVYEKTEMMGHKYPQWMNSFSDLLKKHATLLGVDEEEGWHR